jgi:hypothetical protein
VSRRTVKPRIHLPLGGGGGAAPAAAGGGAGGGPLMPQTITLATGNTVVAGGHTHQLSIAPHTTDPAAHHAPVTLGNTGLSLSGQQLSLRLATVSGLSISSGLRLDDSVAGDGLAIANKVLAVGAGDGIDVSANAIAVDVTDLIGSGLVEEATNNIALNTPGTLSVSSPNAAAGNHTHAVASSANPGAAAAILASDASGYLQLRRIGLGTAPSYPLHVSAATQQARFDYNTSNYLSITVGSDGSTLLSTATGGTGGNLTLAPVGDVIFNPTGNDLLPLTGYDLNIGSLQKKYLTLHCAELWVETLVAHDTIATIGGRILVGPTTELTANLASGAGAMYVKHNEMRYGDRAYLEANGQVEFIGILAYAITAVSVGEHWIKIADDQTAYFPASTPFTIRGSTGNDGNWLCTASEYIAGENRTKITIDSGPASAVADGHILHTGQPGVGPYRYVIERNLDGSGANDWYAGDALFNTGNVGDGFIDLYSVAAIKGGLQAGPTIVGNVRTGTTYNAWAEHWAIGNLSGLYGYGTTAYGFAAGKYANNQSFVTVDATNGIRMLHKNAGGTDITLAQWAVDGVLTIGEVANERNNVRIASGALSIRNNTTERIGLTAAGVLTIKDSSGAAVITLDASAGAEITKKLTMPGADSAIAIGATPPTSASVGTGLWLDRTGLYGLAANVVQAKMDAATGAIVAAAGKTVMDVNGVTLDADTVAGTGAAYSQPGTALKWMRAGTSTKVGSVYGNWNVTLGVGALVLDAQYDASNRAAIALYGTVAGAYIRLSGLVSIDGGLNVGTATGAAAGDASIEGTLTASAITGLRCPYQAELTLNSAGAITVGAGTFYRVDTYEDAASDDLVTILGGSDGKIVILGSQISTRDVVVKNGTGNIYCGADLTLSSTLDRITLQYDAQQSVWLMVAWSNNG